MTNTTAFPMKANIVTDLSDSYHLYWNHSCQGNSIYDALRDSMTEWEPCNPILIDAPTGLGKTHFVFSHLIPKALSRGLHVLLLSNRTALADQQKRDVMKLLDSPLQNRLTSDGIRAQEDFGPVWVTTYHRLPALINDPKNKEWLDKVMFVVADECHFFTSDSAFCHTSSYLLKQLILRFSKSMRIYMTATSFDIQAPLARAEEKYYRNFGSLVYYPQGKPRHFHRYYFPANYDHIDLHFFNQLSDLKEKIQNESSGKWLVFVDSKEEGTRFLSELKEAKVSCAYIDSTLKGSPAWNKLLENQTFSEKCLISTAVIDCGVNIWEDALVSVAIVSDSRVSLQQMLGRKRRKDNERIQLYVCNLTPRKRAERLRTAERLLELAQRYEDSREEDRMKLAAELWREPDNYLRVYFQLTNGRLWMNKIAFHVLKRQYQFLKSLEDPIPDFQAAVRSWLQLPVSAEEDPFEILLHRCRDAEGKQLTDEEFTDFRKLVVTAGESRGMKEAQPTRKETLGPSAINNRLTALEIGYELTNDKVLHGK